MEMEIERSTMRFARGEQIETASSTQILLSHSMRITILIGSISVFNCFESATLLAFSPGAGSGRLYLHIAPMSLKNASSYLTELTKSDELGEMCDDESKRDEDIRC